MMTYAVWIALAVVFIAIAPALFRKRQPDGRDSRGSSGGVIADTGSDNDGGGDGGYGD